MPEAYKILFICEGQLGDSLVLTPALRAVKEQKPDSRISLLLLHRRKYINSHESRKTEITPSDFSGTAEVFLGNPDVDEVLELDRKALRQLRGFKRIKTELRCIKYLRRKKFDAVICTFPQNRFVIWSYLAGIKKRIGQKKQEFGYLLTNRPNVLRSDSGVLKYFCNLLQPLGVECKTFKTFYRIPTAATQKADVFFSQHKIDNSKKIIAIHPGASDFDRQWPPNYYADLINKIGETYQIILCSSEYDVAYIEELKRNLRVPVVEVQTHTISELAAIHSKCDLAVVHNSGPRHLAAAVGTNTLALLEKFDDIMWKIYENEKNHAIIQSLQPCEFCNGSKCVGIIPKGEKYGAKCIHDISVPDVYSRIETMLNNS